MLESVKIIITALTTWSLNLSHLSHNRASACVMSSVVTKAYTCRQDAAAATRKRLDDAAQLKAREEQEKAAQRHQRQEYK